MESAERKRKKEEEKGIEEGIEKGEFYECTEEKDTEIAEEEWICVVIHKHQGADLIRKISATFRCRHPHLKRARSKEDTLEVLAFPIDAEMEENTNRLQNMNIQQIGTVKRTVPAYVPEDADKRKRAQTLWPCVFRPVASSAPDKDLVHRVESLQHGHALHQSETRECADTAVILEEHSAYTLFASERPCTAEEPFAHPILQLVHHTSKITSGYLCTDRVVLLSNEPCFMCGMALVHARTRTVFVCGEVSKDSPYVGEKLHTRKFLNHRFQVYVRARTS
ncbi:tRNA-specific adenosine deaminase 3 [Nematocida sp. AWRm77]|nr:tRNA-specific adenosine deaminase 3 [Nematocida sp. AWRm77]